MSLMLAERSFFSEKVMIDLAFMDKTIMIPLQIDELGIYD